MTAETLEQKVESGSTWRARIVDTITSVTFGLAVGTANELLVVGLSPEQTLRSRAISIPLNAITGRPYGAYRDFLLKKLKITEKSGFFKKALGEFASYTSFWTPVYSIILYCIGADNDQIMAGAVSASIMSTFISHPYGWLQDKARGLFGVKPGYYTQAGSQKAANGNIYKHL